MVTYYTGDWQQWVICRAKLDSALKSSFTGWFGVVLFDLVAFLGLVQTGYPCSGHLLTHTHDPIPRWIFGRIPEGTQKNSPHPALDDPFRGPKSYSDRWRTWFCSTSSMARCSIARELPTYRQVVQLTPDFLHPPMASPDPPQTKRFPAKEVTLSCVCVCVLSIRGRRPICRFCNELTMLTVLHLSICSGVGRILELAEYMVARDYSTWMGFW